MGEYCILVTGIPASGKSTMAEYLGRKLCLPVISKDTVKEHLYDTVGFRSREEKVKLGTAAMNIMYYMAGQLMKCGGAFLLENNFENVSREGLLTLLEKYDYTAITVVLSGDYDTTYRRFLGRNSSPLRHRGHVVNDHYPEETPGRKVPPLSYKDFVSGIESRGMDRFAANGPVLRIDTTDFSGINLEQIVEQIRRCLEEIENG